MKNLEKIEDQLHSALNELKKMPVEQGELTYDYVFEALRLVKNLNIAVVSVPLPLNISKGIEICQRWEQHLNMTDGHDIGVINEQERVVTEALSK